MALDNKISNIIGVRIPEWLKQQLDTRSEQNSKEFRDNNNLIYLTNKTAWVRLVSSVNIIEQRDIDYFKNLGVTNTSTAKGMAQEFTLFGGTSKYISNKSQFRYGIGENGNYDSAAYGMLGADEIRKYGYRPMPGIIRASIETRGRLGSVREANISFKCWDKDQLDIIDALYFKLGFTMFLEWGHTYFYPSPGTQGNPASLDSNKVQSTEFYTIDPFANGLTKEDIYIQIAKNSRASEGNYDAMLGIVTNFNFSYNQEGSYDCQLKIMSLGVLGDSIKINNPSNLPDILEENIKRYNNVLEQIARAKAAKEEQERRAREEQEKAKTETLDKQLTFEEIVKKYIVFGLNGQPQFDAALGFTDSTISTAGLDRNKADIFFNAKSRGTRSPYNNVFGLRRLKAIIPLEESYFPNITAKLDITNFNTILSENKYSLLEEKNYEKNVPLFSETVKAFFKSLIQGDARSIAVNSINAVDQINRKSTVEYEKVSYKRNRRGIENNIEITRNLYAITSTPFVSEPYYLISNKDFVDSLDNFLLGDNNVAIKNIESELEDQQNWRGYKKIVFTFQFELVFNKPVTIEEKQVINLETVTRRSSSNADFVLNVTIKTDDTAIIKSLDLTGIAQPIDFISYEKLISDQNQGNTQEESSQSNDPKNSATKSPLTTMSSLELILRTIQVHSLSEAISASDLDLQRRVTPIELKEDFIKQIFSKGVFSSFIVDLFKGNIQRPQNDSYDALNQENRFKLQSNYGFATNLMGNKANISEFDPVDFKQLLKTYVVPYNISQEIEMGAPLNHPVYVPFGTLLMVLNHCCTVYDNENFQTPLVYIDFNPNTNFCLSNPNQLSTDPFTCLIPFEGQNEDYREIFYPEAMNSDRTAVLSLSGSDQQTPVFVPKSVVLDDRDNVSGGLLPFKYSGGSQVQPYRGKIMNILLNIDYLMDTVRSFSTKNEQNKVFLKPFIEQILIDVGKSLGNMNIFRLSYNDAGNTYQIIDDQIIPTVGGEQPLVSNLDNNAKLPLFGKRSIAKSMEIKTEVSSKLSNMIAISANANVNSKSTLSTNGDTVGYINENYVDRYIPNRGELTGSLATVSDGDKNAAIQFDSAIRAFYNSVEPSKQDVSNATNYYIRRLTNIKGNDPATRAAAMIPVSVNFTTDGVSGFNMGQAFTVPEEMLPYTYSQRVVNNQPNYIDKVGFVVVGLSHTIENNVWDTAVRANMIFLKDQSVYTTYEYVKQESSPLPSGNQDTNTDAPFPTNENYTNYPQAESGYSNIKFAKGYLGSPADDRINPNLLSDINKAAKNSGVTVTITTAVTGHKVKTSTGQTSRHASGNAVDISVVDGVAVSNKQIIQTKVEKFISSLSTLGYVRVPKGGSETGKNKTILAYGFNDDHEDHIHISNKIA